MSKKVTTNKSGKYATPAPAKHVYQAGATPNIAAATPKSPYAPKPTKGK